MSKKVFYAASALALSITMPAAVRAIYCNYTDNTVCVLYDICRQILDKYPESEITETGTDCTLSVDNRQLIIRRKRTAGQTGYFVFRKIVRAGGKDASTGTEDKLTPAQSFAPAGQ